MWKKCLLFLFSTTNLLVCSSETCMHTKIDCRCFQKIFHVAIFTQKLPLLFVLLIQTVELLDHAIDLFPFPKWCNKYWIDSSNPKLNSQLDETVTIGWFVIIQQWIMNKIHFCTGVDSVYCFDQCWTCWAAVTTWHTKVNFCPKQYVDEPIVGICLLLSCSAKGLIYSIGLHFCFYPILVQGKSNNCIAKLYFGLVANARNVGHKENFLDILFGDWSNCFAADAH